MEDWFEAPIDRKHDRAAFDCGDPELNRWLAQNARQSHQRGGAKTFVGATHQQPNRILGFYCLSPASVETALVPDGARKGLGRHEVPFFRLGRLAVDAGFQNRGFGGKLLVAAARRAETVAAEVGGVGLLIDAKNDHVARWYEGYGALRFREAPLTLALPFSTMHR
ncbi:MAG: GNAT family N-acetyltransferase [Rhizobiaceae bacterium]